MAQVNLGEHYMINSDRLTIRSEFTPKYEEIESMTVDLLPPGKHDVVTNTIMDVIPISTKVLGELGDGITHTLTGVYIVMTGAIKDGEQMHEFGSSEGMLREHLKLNRTGTPCEDDYIIHIDLLARPDVSFTRDICLKMFEVTDEYIQCIRNPLKMIDGRLATEIHEYKEHVNLNKPNVALVKQVAGQGAMYDNLLFPNEPSGFSGGTSIIDMANVPIILTANEYRDGAIRAMV